MTSKCLLRLLLVVMAIGFASAQGCAWVSNPTSATCPAACTFDCPTKLCYNANCTTRLDAVSCQAVSGCAWHNGKCRDYNLQFGFFTNCGLSTNAATCGGNCVWNHNVCIANTVCAFGVQRNPDLCPDKCIFSQSTGYCYDATCSAFATQNTCPSSQGCVWMNGYCYDYNLQYSGFPCSSAHERQECPDSRCHWDGEACLAGAATPTPSIDGDAPVVETPAPTAHTGGCAWISNPTTVTCPTRCVFNANLTLCYDHACEHLHSAADCTAVSGCAWSHNVCRDYNLQFGSFTCSLSTSQSSCGGNCQWSYSKNLCMPGSLSSACAFLTQNNPLTCPDRCTYNSGTGLCYNPTCATATTECGCNLLQSAGCSWAYGRCRDYNVQYGSYQCSSATTLASCGRNCVWNAAASTCADPTPFPTPVPTARPTIVPTAVPTAQPTPAPTYEPTLEPTTVEPTTTELTLTHETTLEAAANLRAVQPSTEVSTQAPTSAPTTQQPSTQPPPTQHPGGCAWISNPTNATCPAWCKFNCALNLCYDATCSEHATQVSCQAVNGCAWYKNKCRDYNLQYGSFANCALATTPAACGGNCKWSAHQNACIANFVCAWAPQHAPLSCPDHCIFSQATGLCYDASCASITNQTSCGAVSGCAWYNGYCYDYGLQYSGFSCSLAKEVSECPSSRCHWTGQACVSGAATPVPADVSTSPAPAPAPHPGGCAWVSNPTEATCPAHCTWSAALKLCYDATCPTLHTPSACASVSGCAWAYNMCRDYTLQYGSINCPLATKATCGGSCQWSYNQQRCQKGSLGQACAWLPQNSPLTCPDRCTYNPGTGLCYNPTCASATTECGCNLLQSAGCSWAYGRCRDYNVHYGNYQCTNATSLASCGRNCVWNAATSTCSNPGTPTPTTATPSTTAATTATPAPAPPTTPSPVAFAHVDRTTVTALATSFQSTTTPTPTTSSCGNGNCLCETVTLCAAQAPACTWTRNGCSDTPGIEARAVITLPQHRRRDELADPFLVSALSLALNVSEAQVIITSAVPVNPADSNTLEIIFLIVNSNMTTEDATVLLVAAASNEDSPLRKFYGVVVSSIVVAARKNSTQGNATTPKTTTNIFPQWAIGVIVVVSLALVVITIYFIATRHRFGRPATPTKQVAVARAAKYQESFGSV